MTSFREFKKEINKFMVDSGIRDFCRDYCKGKCCCEVRKECGESCKTGKVPITCSLYVCYSLAHLLGLEKYYDLAERIINKQPEEDQWKPRRIKIGKEEEELLKLLKCLNRDKIDKKLEHLKQIIYMLNMKC